MAGLASQMKRYCDRCKRYAGHLAGKMRCFRVRMTANFRHGMVIPNKFIEHFGGKISRTIELESRNGSMYTVEVSKLMNETVLRRRGWEAFVDAHRVKENDSLLFRHIEKSRFGVLVLDSDDCEKVLPSAGIKIASCNVQESSSVDYIEISSSVDYIDISSSSGDDTCERGNSSHPRKTAVNSPCSEEDSGEDTDAAEEHSEHELSFELDDDRQTPCAGRGYILSRSGRLSGAQEERVTRLLQDVGAETPVFVAIMKMSTRNRAIVIPKLFAEEHFPRESQNLTLQRPGKSKKWHPWFYIRKDQCGHALSGHHWLGFLRDNRVQEGDLCVFQPVQGTGTRSKFTVHLLRESVGGNGTGSPKERVGCSTTLGNTRVNSVDPEIATTAHCHGATTMAKAALTTRCVNKEQDDGTSSSVDYIDISSSSGNDTTRSSGSKRFATCERSDSSHPRKTAVNNPSSEEDSGDDSDAKEEEHSEDEPSFGLDDDCQTPCAGHDYVLSRSACLSGPQEERVTRLLQAVGAETPVFVAIMKMSTRNRAIVIPKLFAEEHFPRESQNLTLQRPGKSNKWHPCFYIRKSQCGHVLTGSGWVGFLRDNGVREGDLCVFQPVKGTGTRSKFTVHLLRLSLGAKAAEASRVNKEPDDGCNHGRQTQRARQLPKPACPYILSSAARLTEEQEREVDRTARAIGSRVPVYVSVMNRSSVGAGNRMYNVTISSAYAAEYLPARERVAVTLVRRKKAWEVEMRARGGGRTLARGWRGFARDNRLRVQDVCLFQPVEKNHRSLAMAVHIIRHSGKRKR